MYICGASPFHDSKNSAYRIKDNEHRLLLGSNGFREDL